MEDEERREADPGTPEVGEGVARLATLTLLRVRPRSRGFAVARMVRARWELADVDGALGAGVRLLGSGRGAYGFSIMPSVDCYGLLAPAWRSPEAAEAFLHGSRWMARYAPHVTERLDLWLAPVSGRGEWDGVSPFAPIDDEAPVAEAPLAVLTRATLRARSLAGFFRGAAQVELDLPRCGALLAIGLGERPWVRQATFSVWPDLASMKRFAYEEPAHREMIRRARADGWFAEDLFYRFRVVAAEGSWGGASPFPGVAWPGVEGFGPPRRVRGSAA